MRVRSNRPLATTNNEETDGVVTATGAVDSEETDAPPPSPPPVEFDDIKDELPYVQILNRLLPPDIRVLAWAAHPPADFSARFNCRGRHYRYYFSNPAVAPRHTTGHLDISRMREAASYFLGEHDFRNFCKLDASKQINNFKRVIYASSIEEVPNIPTPTSNGAESPKMYYFNLHGTAFLWHQVRHMIAMLFLVGQGSEEPTLIRQLLDVSSNPRRPQYEMADDKALVLWDCYFPEGVLDWVYGQTEEKDGLMDTVWMGWHRTRIEEVLRGELVGAVENVKRRAIESMGVDKEKADVVRKGHVLVEGGSRVVYRGKYIPVLERPRLDDIEVLNEKYRNNRPQRATGKGKARRAREAEVAASLEGEKGEVEVEVEVGSGG